MFSIEDWSKERVYNVMMELLYSFNYMWFLMEQWVDKNCPKELGQKGMLQMTDEFGAYEARRLKKTVDDKVEGIDQLISFLEHSHWAAFEDLRITKISDTRMRMMTLGCTSQKAAKKWGMEYYDCSEVAQRLRLAFLKEINPKVTVTPVFLPPEKPSDDYPTGTSCEWIVSIE